MLSKIKHVKQVITKHINASETEQLTKLQCLLHLQMASVTKGNYNNLPVPSSKDASTHVPHSHDHHV
jgi:hypothetical protein